MSTSEQLEIDSVAFSDAGLVISFMRVPTDVRGKGTLAQHHQLRLDARHPDYRDDMDDLHRKAVKVLKNALEDFEESEPFEPDLDDDDDDDRGMGE